MSKSTFEESFLGYKFQVFNEKPKFELLHTKQVHGAFISIDTELKIDETEADGILTNNLKIPLAIKTADCLPIVIIGSKGAAHLHAGWRGVHQKIVQSSTLDIIEPHFFYIGPHIQPHHFEVQEDFKLNFPASKNFNIINNKLTFNLAAEVSEQIHQNWPKAQIQVCSLSTFDNPLFHSFRENGTAQRNWNVLSIEN